MRQTKLFSKTLRDVPKDEVSINARLLIRAGFIDKLSAGVYSYLPLGLRVLKKIQHIVREEMDRIGGQEILLPALTPKELYDITGRWNEIDVLFKVEGGGGRKYALGATHEEVVTPLVKKFVHSYRDLPVAVYQIQDKFRDEPRAKSGLLRGREFNMKDLYSFHTDRADFEHFYEQAKQAYLTIFQRCGLDAVVAEASGGVFSEKPSHEFQVFTAYGEDTIFFCPRCGTYKNAEIVRSVSVVGTAPGKPAACAECQGALAEKKAIEVGNIFPLETKFSAPFKFDYLDAAGKKQPVIMGCYGIGPSRVLGSVAEVHHDKEGLIWPASIAPYAVHLVSLCQAEADIKTADRLYETLTNQGKEVLYDDRTGARAGEKFADSDLLGLPKRVLISPKTLAKKSVEIKDRAAGKTTIVRIKSLAKLFSK